MNEEDERAQRPMKIDPLPKKKRQGERYQTTKKTKSAPLWISGRCLSGDHQHCVVLKGCRCKCHRKK